MFTAARRSAFALLLHGNAPCGHRCGGQCDRVEDQPETPRRSRDCEGHSRQRQGPVAYVDRGGTAEGGTPVRSDGPAADLTFHGDVLRRPEERGAHDRASSESPLQDTASSSLIRGDPDLIAGELAKGEGTGDRYKHGYERYE